MSGVLGGFVGVAGLILGLAVILVSVWVVGTRHGGKILLCTGFVVLMSVTFYLGYTGVLYE